MSLFEVDGIDAAIDAVRGHCDTAAITRGAAGSTIVTNGEVISIPAEPVERVVDTTGAGDLFAAGVLHGMTQGYELPACGRIGSIAAGEIISHYGARPETPLAGLVQQRLR